MQRRGGEYIMAAVTKTKVKVEVVKDYKDSEKKLLFHPGETHEVTEERVKVLEAAGVVKVIRPEAK